MIPKMLTTEYLENEKIRLYKKIKEVEGAIDELNRRLGNVHAERLPNNFPAITRMEVLIKNATGNSNPLTEINAQYRRRDISTQIEGEKSRLESLKAEWSDVEALLRITDEAKRLENHYQQVFGTYNNSAFNEKKWLELAKQFSAMIPHKNSEEFAKECENRVKYERLCKRKKKKPWEENFQVLAQEFEAMIPYRNTVELANECKSEYNSFETLKTEVETKKKQRKITIQCIAIGLAIINLLVFIALARAVGGLKLGKIEIFYVILVIAFVYAVFFFGSFSEGWQDSERETVVKTSGCWAVVLILLLCFATFFSPNLLGGTIPGIAFLISCWVSIYLASYHHRI